MVITHSGSDSVAIKTKTETVIVGPGLTIGQFSLPGAGEYDIASIQCEGLALTSSVAYLVRAEDLTLLVLDHLDETVTKIDDASKADILIADIRSDDTSDNLKDIVKALEPSFVVLHGAGATDSFVEALGLPKVEGDSLKVTRTGLPLEGTSLLARA